MKLRKIHNEKVHRHKRKSLSLFQFRLHSITIRIVIPYISEILGTSSSLKKKKTSGRKKEGEGKERAKEGGKKEGEGKEIAEEGKGKERGGKEEKKKRDGKSLCGRKGKGRMRCKKKRRKEGREDEREEEGEERR